MKRVVSVSSKVLGTSPAIGGTDFKLFYHVETSSLRFEGIFGGQIYERHWKTVVFRCGGAETGRDKNNEKTRQTSEQLLSLRFPLRILSESSGLSFGVVEFAIFLRDENILMY